MDLKELFRIPSPYADHYLGYSVIRNMPNRCLGRTVIDPWRIGRGICEGCYLLRTKQKVHIGGFPFAVEGYPYMSQDAEATVCAHACLWGMCRYLSERYSAYRELYPFDLVDLTEEREGRTYPSRGMTYSDYCKILSSFGCFPVTMRMSGGQGSGFRATEEFKDLCTYVESGFPVLASLRGNRGTGHVVSLIGHTIAYGQPLAVGEMFVDSSTFWDYFIVVDDNNFPYAKLGSKSSAENHRSFERNGYSIDTIMTAVCPLPEKVFMAPQDARRKGRRYFAEVQIMERLNGLRVCSSQPVPLSNAGES